MRRLLFLLPVVMILALRSHPVQAASLTSIADLATPTVSPDTATPTATPIPTTQLPDSGTDFIPILTLSSIVVAAVAIRQLRRH